VTPEFKGFLVEMMDIACGQPTFCPGVLIGGTVLLPRFKGAINIFIVLIWYF